MIRSSRFLTPLFAALALASGCGKSSPTAPPLPPSPTMTTEMRAGVVQLPPAANVEATELEVITFAGSDPVDATGQFEVAAPIGSAFQVLFVSHETTGKPVLLGLYDPQTRTTAANDTSTALALALINPYLIGTTQPQRAEYLAAARGRPEFAELLAIVQGVLASDGPNALDGQRHPEVYQAAVTLMRATMTALGGSLVRTGETGVQALVPSVEDEPGGDIALVNPTFVWYAAGIHPNNGARTSTVSMNRRKELVEMRWGWPPVYLSEPVKTKVALGDGDFRILMAKGLDFTKFTDWDDPKGRATVLNTVDGALYMVELVLGATPALSTTQLLSLPRYLHVSADVAAEFAIDMAQGDVNGLVLDFAALIVDNADEFAFWLWQSTTDEAATRFLQTAGSILQRVTLVLEILAIGNEELFFFSDLVSAQDEVNVYLTQAGGVMHLTEQDMPPAAVFHVSPPAGIVNTMFTFDASATTDDRDAIGDITFRWDWQADGIWDTDWLQSPSNSHAYPERGAYSVVLEARDRRGGIGRAVRLISVGGGRGTANHVKIFRNNLPWDSNALTIVLASLGFSPGTGPDKYEVLPSSAMGSASLIPGEDLVIIANDQTQSFYDDYAAHQVRFADFVRGGGAILWEACDIGWANGSMALAGVVLPAGVQSSQQVDSYNFLRNPSLPLVAGLPGTMDHNYASHEEFTQLPDGTTIYCVNESERPTLVEFSYGSGWVVLTGQPLEHQYDRIFGAPDMERLLPRIVAYFTGRNLSLTDSPVVAETDRQSPPENGRSSLGSIRGVSVRQGASRQLIDTARAR